MKYYKTHLQQQHRNNIDLACKMYPVLDKKSLKKHEEELYNESYLPRYLLKELNIPKYYENLKKNNQYGKYLKQFFKYPHNLQSDIEVEEFYEWVQKHEKYKELLDVDNYNELTDILDMLNQIQQNIIKQIKEAEDSHG